MRQLSEIKVMTKDEQNLLTRCRKVIKNIEPSAEVILYGSRARGDASEEADYDLLVLVDGEVSLKREDLICRQLYPIELETGKVLSAIVHGRQQWNTPLYRAMPFHQNIEKEGIIL
ncbi:MAG: nucleotidyltransferase domain-containing protein [Elusimicrobiota bacterium]